MEKALNTNSVMNLCQKITLLTIFFFVFFTTPAISDTLDTSQSIRDGETLVSSGGMFELGFFGLGNSWYLGIWYRNITPTTYVWVANREAPLQNNTGVLRVTQPGILALFNRSNGTIIWSSNATRSVGNPTARLLESGNLVVKDANDENYLWQSFDYPTDTFLPGMSVGWNYVTGVESFVSSWRSGDDPSRGEYSLHLDATGYPQILFRRNENGFKSIVTRIGPWNGIMFSGAPRSAHSLYTLTFQMNENETKYRQDAANTSVITRTTLSWNGITQRWIWNAQSLRWFIDTTIPADGCDVYNSCGANSICNGGNSGPCTCLDRFVTRESSANGNNGCVRRNELNCRDDVFLSYPGIKMPDARNSLFNDRIISLADCEVECSRNCNCTAYTQLNISGSGSGCLFYHGELIDIRTLPSGAQDLYIRLAYAERENGVGSNRMVLIASLISVVVGIGLVCLSLVLYYRHKKKKKKPRLGQEGILSGNVGKEADLPFFTLSTLVKATDNFSNNKKLGEGGFGPVYKGMLEDGQEIAVKRLSKTSTQGVDELKNEVILITKLQHRNLVRTLGCCAEGEENMLIYEYMSNSSLDLILFDETKCMLLDWEKRFNIINGIAKGLLYLHQDSRLRIIHRDLKASNILLDADMIPKISDFGLARSFGGNQTEAQTRRVVGTYGYMSPEYAIDGLFSIKSDVFSFGVLVLEIVSGKRNRGFFLEEHNLNLLGHAWTLLKEGNSSKLVDPSIGDSFDLSQVLRSIHVGLLCVQKSPEDRPNMSSVVFMLGNEVELPQPKQPGFFTERDLALGQTFSKLNAAANSQNQVTITWMEGR